MIKVIIHNQQSNCKRDVRLNSKGKPLMVGPVYCGHCGSKLVLTTSDGMSGYSVDKVDKVMEQTVMAMFENIKSVSEQELGAQQYVQRANEHLATLARLRSLKEQKKKEPVSYKSEVYKSIQSKSTCSQELLSELIQESKVELEKLDVEIDTAKSLIDGADKAAKDIKEQYDRILT